MKKIILALLLFGVVLSVLSVFADGARRVGTGIEWEAQNIRVVVTNGKDDKFISLKGLYSRKLFEAKGNKIGKDHIGKKGFPYLHEGSLLKTVIDNDSNGIDACPEIVSMGISTIRKEILIVRSRAMALLYKTMKTVYLKNDVAKKNFDNGKYKNCVAAKDIVDNYHAEIARDSFLKEGYVRSPKTPRWTLWQIKISDEWRSKLKLKNRIVNAKDAKLYFCSQGEDTKDVDEVVYHLNFGIPLGDLYDNELFYQTSVGSGFTFHSKEEWGKARKRAAACTACAEGEIKGKDSMPPVFYSSLKGAITYLYYGYYHNLDLAKRSGNKTKDSHLHLMKADIHGLMSLLIKEYKADIGIYEAAALSKCSDICVGEDNRNKKNKYTKLRTLWECRLFLPMTVSKYGKSEVNNNRCKAIGSTHKYPFDASGTGKPIDTYWADIEAGTSPNLKWKKRKALIVVAENRNLGNRALKPAKLIRNAFIPTIDPDAAEKNVIDGWDNLLKLQLGATDKNNGDNDSKQEED